MAYIIYSMLYTSAYGQGLGIVFAMSEYIYKNFFSLKFFKALL